MKLYIIFYKIHFADVFVTACNTFSIPILAATLPKLSTDASAAVSIVFSKHFISPVSSYFSAILLFFSSSSFIILFPYISSNFDILSLISLHSLNLSVYSFSSTGIFSNKRSLNLLQNINYIF